VWMNPCPKIINMIEKIQGRNARDNYNACKVGGR
jgi:hypothetical protein